MKSVSPTTNTFIIYLGNNKLIAIVNVLNKSTMSRICNIKRKTENVIHALTASSRRMCRNMFIPFVTKPPLNSTHFLQNQRSILQKIFFSKHPTSQTPDYTLAQTSPIVNHLQPRINSTTYRSIFHPIVNPSLLFFPSFLYLHITCSDLSAGLTKIALPGACFSFERAARKRAILDNSGHFDSRLRGKRSIVSRE